MTTPPEPLLPDADSLLHDQYFTAFDVAYERVNAKPLTDIDVGVVGLLDPLRAPYSVLPFLAELYYADTWSPDFSEEYQRQAIQSSWYFLAVPLNQSVPQPILGEPRRYLPAHHHPRHYLR